MSISYEAIGQVLVTCQAEKAAVEGHVVKLSANDTVTACAAGEQICGVAVGISEDGFAAVQVKGFVTVPCSGSGITAGYMSLTADGSGGVKAAGSGDKGLNVLVMNVEDGAAVLCL